MREKGKPPGESGDERAESARSAVSSVRSGVEGWPSSRRILWILLRVVGSVAALVSA